MTSLNQKNLHLKTSLVRALQGFIYRLFSTGQILVPIHFAFGHELAACSVTASASPNCLFLPHRNMHYQIASCFSNNEKFDSSWFRKYLDELTLNQNRCASGSLGAMNYTHIGSKGYTSSILANQLGVAIGSCLGRSMSKSITNDRTVVVIGDGALEEGRFWESLIMAKTHNLALDIVIEDNDWSMQSSIDQRRYNIDLKSIANAFDIPYIKADDQSSLVTFEEGPRIIHFKIETLGWTTLRADNSRNERVINYHAGGLPDKKNRSHYSDFFSMSQSDKLQRDLLPDGFDKQLIKILKPLAKDFEVEGFL